MAASQVQVSSRDQNVRPSVVRTRLLSRKRWGISQMTTLRWSLEEDLRFYAEAGICQIGLSRNKVSESGEEESARLLRESGLRPSSLSWAGGFTGSNGYSHRESLADALDVMETAQTLGSPLVVFVTGGQGQFTPRHGRGLVVESLKRLGDSAIRMGVGLALQPIHPKFAGKTSLVTDLSMGVELLERVNHPAVGLALDLFALGHDEGFFRSLPSAIPHCRLVTLSDSAAHPKDEYDRVPLGAGVLPIIEAVRMLECAGYSGAYEFQSLSDVTWKMSYKEVIKETVGYFDQLIDSP